MDELLASYEIELSQLALGRILFAAYIVAREVPVAGWIPRVPEIFFRPPAGLPSMLPLPPPPGLIAGLNLVLVILATMLLVGWRIRLASLGTAGCLLVLKAYAYSLGKIDHDILLVLAPLLLAFSGWGERLSADGP